MKDLRGIIVDIQKDTVIVLTPDADVVEVETNGQQFKIGQEILFYEMEQEIPARSPRRRAFLYASALVASTALFFITSSLIESPAVKPPVPPATAEKHHTESDRVKRVAMVVGHSDKKDKSTTVGQETKDKQVSTDEPKKYKEPVRPPKKVPVRHTEKAKTRQPEKVTNKEIVQQTFGTEKVPVRIVHPPVIAKVPARTVHHPTIAKAPVRTAHPPAIAKAPARTEHPPVIAKAPARTEHPPVIAGASVSIAEVPDTAEASVSIAEVPGTAEASVSIAEAPARTSHPPVIAKPQVKTVQPVSIVKAPIKPVHQPVRVLGVLSHKQKVKLVSLCKNMFPFRVFLGIIKVHQ